MRKLLLLLSAGLLAVVCHAQTVPQDYFGLHIQCAASTDPNQNPNSSPANKTNQNYNPDCGTKVVSFPSIATAPTPSVPFGQLRMWDDKVKFSQVETASGTYFWDTFNYWVNVARANNLELLYEAGASTPTWACSSGSSPSCVPTDAAESGFITAVLTHGIDTLTGLTCTSGSTCRPAGCTSTGTWAGINTGCIRYLDVWNEPNTSGSYAGTMAQMVHLAALAKTARNGISGSAVYITSPSYTFSGSSISPTGNCSGMGTSNSPEDYTCSFLQTTSSTPADGVGSAQVDVIAFHPYPATNTINTIAEATMNNRSTGMANAMTANSISLCGHGVANGTSGCKSLLATEGSWGFIGNGSSIANGLVTTGTCSASEGCPRIYPTNDTTTTSPESTCSTTVAYPGYGCWASDQAAFLVKYYVLGWTNGLKHNSWYWWAQSDSNNPWGILYCLAANTALGCPSANNLQPAAVAFGELQTWMVGATMNSACSTANGSGTNSLYLCSLTLANGHSARIVWDSGYGPGTSGSYSYSDVAFNRVTDMYGNQSTVSSPATVGYAPVLLEQIPATTFPGLGGVSGFHGSAGIH